jgi:hypothetical protein
MIITSGYSENPRLDFLIWAKSYKNSANYLLDNLIEKVHYNDSEGYPIFFLLRHSLELCLKDIIYRSAILISFENLEIIDKKLNDPKNNKTHDLIYLNEKCSIVLTELFPKISEVLFLNVELKDLCLKISELDKNSFSYRYPIDNIGNYSTKPNQAIDLNELSIKFNNIFGIIENLSFGIFIEIEHLRPIIEDLFID